jgi:hypothetical protein
MQELALRRPAKRLESLWVAADGVGNGHISSLARV